MRFHAMAAPSKYEITTTMLQNTFVHKFLCCNKPSDKNFLRKRACVRPRLKEHCAAAENPSTRV